ncbi:MAG: Cna B-type domain-containing protein, partial [Anaerolineaceae bacterium]
MKRLNKFLSIVLLLTMVSSNTFIVTAQSLTQPTRLDSQTTSSQLPGDSPEDKGIDLPSQPILESDKGKIIGPVEPALPTDPVKDPITPPPVFTTRVPIETTQTPEPSQEPTEAAPEEPQPTATPTPEAPGEQFIDVTAIVKWSFGPSTRPTIWLKLYRNVQGGPVTAIEDAPVKMLSGSATMATWAKMPSADENGKKYEYSVKQVDASGNPLILDAYTTSISGLTVMNVFKTGQTKTVVANLVWKDNPLAKGGIIDWLAHKLEAPTVYFQLMQVSGESTIPTVVPGAPLIMMESGTLQASWPNMPVEDADRNLITYSVKQVDASGQPFSPKGFTTTEDGLTVTNVYTDPAGFGQIMGVPNPIACGPFSPQAGYTVTFPINTSTNSHTVLKLMWVSGDQYHIALVATHATQSATINGVSLSFVGSCDILVPLTVGGVTYPATGASGNTKDSRWVIYSAPLSSLGLGDTGNSLYVQGIGGGHDLNTSFGVSINKIAVTATKVWVGGMEDSVTAYLMVDGVRDETSGKTLAASEWKATWTNLDEITMAGRFIIYSVQEDPVPAGYEVSYSGGPYNHTITNTKKATLELKKIWVGTPGSVYLNIGATQYGTEIASQLTTDTILTTGPKPVAPGTYYFSETNGPNTDLSDYISTFNCTVTPAGANVNAVMPSVVMPDNIVLEAGESAVCTYTNTQRAKIVVDKVTEPAGSRQSFSFTTTGFGYNNFSLKDTDPANSQIVDSGHYTVSETVPPGWKQKSAVCVSSIGSAQAPDNINIVAGETVTCTFTNTKRGNLILRKMTDPVTDPKLVKFTFYHPNATGISRLGHGEQISSRDLDPGAYTFTEKVPAGWSLSSVVCDDERSATPSTFDLAAGTATFNIDPGETVICTFTNSQNGSIELKKVWEGKVGSVNLTIGSASGGSDIANITTDDTVLTTGAKSVAPGTYYLSETGNGTDLSLYASTLVCSVNGAPATASDGSVNVGTGDTVVCTYTNTQRAKIVVDKVTEPAGSGQSFSFTTSGSGYNNFSLKDTDPANSQM